MPRLSLRVHCHLLLPPWSRKVFPGLRDSRVFGEEGCERGKVAGFSSQGRNLLLPHTDSDCWKDALIKHWRPGNLQPPLSAQLPNVMHETAEMCAGKTSSSAEEMGENLSWTATAALANLPTLFQVCS